MLVEVIMRNRNRNRMAHVTVAIQAEMPILDDNINRRVAEVGHQVDHDPRRPHTMMEEGMMMEEVSNKIHIEPSCTSQSQIITHEFLAGNHLAKYILYL